MSLKSVNKQLEDVRAELDKRIFQNYYRGKEQINLVSMKLLILR